VTDQITTPILIVGGGPVGLSLALDLGWRGIKHTLIERDSGTAVVMLAKANGLDERTMEMYRRWGVSDRLKEVGFPADHPGDTVYATSLNGYYIGRSILASMNESKTPAFTPQKAQRAPQYELDPVLANAVKTRGLTDILYGTEFDRFEQDEDGVTVKVIDVKTQRSFTIRCKYLVACDGAGSKARQLLGISFEGKQLDFSLSAMIRIPNLKMTPANMGGERYLLINESSVWCVFTSVDGREIWRITVHGSQDRLDVDRYDITADIKRAIGSDDVPFEILRLIPWRRSQCSAAKYEAGRVVLAGDSAHTMSPTGGHGLNTGVGDVSDLSWMLQASLDGWGGKNLLKAYEQERRPVGIRNAASCTRNYAAWVQDGKYTDVFDPGPKGDACRKKVGDHFVNALKDEWYSVGIALGYRYENSPVIVPDGSPPTPDSPIEYIPTARPGHRAPHAWLSDGRSTIDLFGHGFVLLRFAHDLDVSTLENAARSLGVPLMTYDVEDPKIASLYERKLVLVRPDGFVAWRADKLPADNLELLNTVRGAKI